MYIIYDKSQSILQIGFKELASANLQNGIIISETSLNKYYDSENLFILNNNNFLVKDNEYLFKDFRFTIKNCILKNLILIAIKNFKIKFIYKNIKKLIIYIFLSYFVINYFSFFFSKKQEEIKEISREKNNLIYEFKNSEKANYIYHNKFQYFNFEIPELKGIDQYRVIPLNINSQKLEPYKSIIAIPYSIITSIKLDKSIIKKNYLYKCDNKNLYFFEITENDDILILNQDNFTGYNDYITFFQEKEYIYELCNENIYKKYMD
jgi:hypothetical protein